MNIVRVPQILIPKKGVDLKKWAVIACDQYTGNEDYWKTLEDYCGEVSTLRMIFPEIYISQNNEPRIQAINAKMQEYLDNDIFDEYNGFVLTVRHTAYGNRRIGLLLSFDLEEYDINCPKAVRATEATVKERLPVRIEIREKSPIELPHALVLIDDDTKTVIEDVYARRSTLKKLYTTELNMGGGTLEGYLVEDTKAIMDAIEKVTSRERCLEKYGSDKPFTFAVGDGNHSIATAKACWEEIKKGLTEEERENHPSRYCLVEINNIYDDDLKFEPINRALYGAGRELIDYLHDRLDGEGFVDVLFGCDSFKINVNENCAEAISDIQRVLDNYIKEHPNVRQDYLHGREDTIAAARDKGGVAVIMPKLRKSELFKYVAEHGTLMRKSFSMGEAKEKRYYFECKRIR